MTENDENHEISDRAKMDAYLAGQFIGAILILMVLLLIKMWTV